PILVSAEIIVYSPGVVRGSNAGARHHLANEFYGFAIVVAAVNGGDSFVENFGGPLADTAIEFSGFWVAIEAPAWRVRRAFGYAGSAVCEGIGVSSVTPAM